MLYVAVVVKKNGAASGRAKGDWSCFTGNVKAEVIERALEAKRDWQRNGYGPYDVLVGRIAEAVRVPQNWELVSLSKWHDPEGDRI